jgi:DNA-binding response OmpR family regulator
MPERVLVVDDDPDIRTIARIALGAVGGMDVVCAADAEGALALAVERLPDLVVLDFTMPECDGFTCLEKLRGLPGGAAVPVVFFTARADTVDTARTAEAGVRAIIAKPFDPMTLAARLRAVLAGAAAR